MDRTATIVLYLPVLWACVPEWKPDTGTAPDAEDGTECTHLPSDIEIFEPLAGTETGYDHRGGLSGNGDEGVIYHNAFLVRDEHEGRYTMLSLQDFRGEEAGDRTGEIVDMSHPDIPPGGLYEYLDRYVAVLFLVDCPYESLGGCERQFLAVSGTVTFVGFDKATEWNVDGVDVLDVELRDLEFREVRIDPLTYETTTPDHVCPGEDCSVEGDECLTIPAYDFSYTSD